jgi:predicted RNA binding protein YcfA (HicA-like mRNA interferase family)
MRLKMNKKQMLEKLRNGKSNINKDFFVKVLKAFGFNYDRTEGSHEIYKHNYLLERMNIQYQTKKKGQVKPYQVKQFLNIVKKYSL